MADMRLQQQRNENSRNAGQKAPAKKKKSGGFWAVLVLIVIGLMDSGLEDLFSDGEAIGIAAAVIILLTVLIIGVSVLRMNLKKKRGEAGLNIGGRTSAAVRRPDPRSRSFTPPEPSCIVCDHTGEDHFARDKAQRIAQLDEWLKNGLVDREEYRVLKDRFQRDL